MGDNTLETDLWTMNISQGLSTKAKTKKKKKKKRQMSRGASARRSWQLAMTDKCEGTSDGGSGQWHMAQVWSVVAAVGEPCCKHGQTGDYFAPPCK